MRLHLLLAAFTIVPSIHSIAGEPAAVPPRRAPGGMDRPMQASIPHLPVSVLASLKPELPPLPAGVEELKFSDFFKLPVGPRGLEPSKKLRSLDGHKVRLTGFYVFEDWSNCNCAGQPLGPLTPAAARRMRALPTWMKHVVPGRIMMAPTPVTVSLGHYGLCDDLPPQVAYVEIASRFGEPVMYQPGIFAVTGTLHLGTKDEPDGRTSFVHLKVERDEDLVPLRVHAGSSTPSGPSAPSLPPATATASAGAAPTPR